MIASYANSRITRATRPARSVENRIVNRLRADAGRTPNYWDFRDNVDDLTSKTLFHYPAMMVPALQKQVIAAILKTRPGIETIADPFMGSGTILALAMLSGRSFVGQDINPLAILIAKTRAYSLDHECLEQAVARVSSLAKNDHSQHYAIRFRRQFKCFTRGASIGLSRLRRAILRESDINTRRFLWVCLAETIRFSSNSRMSTYKLHVKPPTKRTATTNSVLRSFAGIAGRNLKIVLDFRSALFEAGRLDASGSYARPITIAYGDTALGFPPVDWEADHKYPLVVTSPPYGDNRTTVPYGQAAWLPLQWIDFADIDPSIPADAATRASDVDSRSLGGTRLHDFDLRLAVVSGAGKRTKRYLTRLAAVSRHGLSRFVHFVYDLRDALDHISRGSGDDAHNVLTPGSRNISGTVCPLH